MMKGQNKATKRKKRRENGYGGEMDARQTY
jgi:hypothetical protein